MAQMAATRERLRAELGVAYDSPVPGLDTADADNGKAVYEANCVSCHGATGKGDGVAAAGLNPPPSDFTDAFHARYYTDAGRMQIIRKGSPDTAMAGFEGSLSDAQILDVYAYVRALRGDVGAPAAGGHEHGHDHPHGDDAGHTH
jgi:high-affinity iron transporter